MKQYKVFLMLVLGYCSTLFALHVLPYNDMPKNHFGISIWVDTNAKTEYELGSSDIIGYNTFTFNFSNVSYGFTLLPLVMPKSIEVNTGPLSFPVQSDVFIPQREATGSLPPGGTPVTVTIPAEEVELDGTMTSMGQSIQLDGTKLPMEGVVLPVHNFTWEPFDFSLPWLKSGVRIQTGFLNFGLPDDLMSEDSFRKYNRYLKKAYVTWRLQPFYVYPFYVYVSKFNLHATSDFQTAFAISFERQYVHFKLEYEKILDKEVFFVGMESYLFSGLIFKLGAYPLDSFNKKLLYRPKYFLGFEIRSAMISRLIEKKKNKKRVRKPLYIDDFMFLELEKGSLDYFNMDYRSAMVRYERVLSKYPNFPLVLERLGSIYYELGLHAQAQKSWEDALKYTPANKDIQFYLNKLRSEKPVTP
ncbi:MAG: hypothetical protein VW378_00180 [bacterium]